MALTEIPIELSSTPGIVDNSNSTAITIDSSENVGIGSATANHFSTAGATNILGVKGTSGGLISIAATGTNFSGIDVGTDTTRRGGIYSLDGSHLAFYTNATNSGGSLTERMRIDSSGNLLVGTTATDTAAVGFRYRKSLNAISSVADGGVSAYFGRRSSDGDIVTFRKDDATVGSIGTEGGDLTIGVGTNCGLQFNDGNAAIRPFNMAGNAPVDNAVSLGISTQRFKDLYLSGGVVFGTTGGAVTSKTLDDYEEGSYDCTISCGTSGTISLNGSFNRAAYTKVGRLVTVHGFIVVSAVSSPVGFFNITLPFTPASLPDRAGDSTVDLVIQNVVSANISDFVGTINEGDARIYVQLGDNTAIQNDSAQQIAANTYIHFSTTYSTV